MDMLVVIVNYRTADLVADCLASLRSEVAAVAGGAKVVVVEGASGDGSAEAIQQCIDANGYGPWCELLPLDHNGGFAYGNNAGIEMALGSDAPPRYVLLLNPDTTVFPGALTELIAFMDAHPRCGIAGSRCENPDGTARNSAFRFHSILGEFEREARFGPASRLLNRWAVAPPRRDSPHRTDWVSGAAMCVRREVFEQIGLMDPEYFLYYEETDFCLRAARAGWECWYVPASRIIHLCGQSSGITGAKRAAKRVPRYWFDSRRRYFRKNHGAAYALLADVAWLTGSAIWEVRKRLARPTEADPPRRYADFLRYTVPEWVR